MKKYKVGLSFIGMSSLLLLMSPLANAAEMSNMDHSSMDMSGMDMSGMDMSGDMSGMDMSGDMSGMDMSGDMSEMDMSGDMSEMDHSKMDMSNMDHSGMDMSGDMSGMDMAGMDHGSMSMDTASMQGGEAPADARSSDYSNGVTYGQYDKPVMMGSAPLWGVSVETLGYQFEDDQIDFEAEGWYGTDSNRVTLRSEGSAQTEGDKEIDSLTSLAYWKPLGIYWNGEAGVAYNTENDKSAIMAGIVGTAPYFVETDARAYVYTDGQVQLDLGTAYEWRLAQRWIVRPEVQLTAFSKDDTDNGITKGFNELETEVRLAYETLSRQLSPYVGFSYASALGDARDLRRQENVAVDSSSVTAGVMFWF
ncbi:copper resistance protein B [Psychrobacter immobilis]|uniref:copper resistance protein B n=1 Tax=Psychrobacter immobilis TaxID=498 RepID=UPI0019183819|nr:copper resistance protein B [Psychrobacter immobilis]